MELWEKYSNNKMTERKEEHNKNDNIPIPKIKHEFKPTKFLEEYSKICKNSGIDKISLRIKKLTEGLIPIANQYVKNIEEMTRPLQETIQRMSEIVKPISEMMTNYTLKMTPYFSELAQALEKAEKNPNSLINWINYYDKLSDYLWTFPYGMKSEKLKEILSNVNSEEQFDAYMLEYFNHSLILEMEKNIYEMLPKKHKIMFKQIICSFNNKCYAISNIGITAMLDDLCTFFLEDKGCNSRNDLLLPIIEDIDESSDDKFEVIPILILNSNLNMIYEYVDFQKKITINTHKTTRRHTNQHGKKFDNKKLDTIMLLNTLYYMLIVQKEYAKYKNKVIYIKDKKSLERVKTNGSNEIKRFYLKKKYYRKSKT